VAFLDKNRRWSVVKVLQEQIRNFIVENFLFGDASNGVGDSDSLLDNGVIDSTGVLELVSYLEKNFGIRVEDEELVPENLDSISSVSAYILRKQGQGSPQLTAQSGPEPLGVRDKA
jgi:acyl carrier protein